MFEQCVACSAGAEHLTYENQEFSPQTAGGFLRLPQMMDVCAQHCESQGQFPQVEAVHRTRQLLKALASQSGNGK